MDVGDAPNRSPASLRDSGLSLELTSSAALREEERERQTELVRVGSAQGVSVQMQLDGLHLCFHERDPGGGADFFGIEFRAQPGPAGGGSGGGGGGTLKVVRRIASGSVASSLGLLGPGMILQQVQGQPVDTLSLGEVLQLLGGSAPPLRLVFSADGLPDVVALETPRDAYGFPFAVGHSSQSGYFRIVSPCTHQRIERTLAAQSSGKGARKQTEAQERHWVRWLEALSSQGDSGTAIDAGARSTARKLARRAGVPEGAAGGAAQSGAGALRKRVWLAMAEVEALRGSAPRSYAQLCQECQDRPQADKAEMSLEPEPEGRGAGVSAFEEALEQIEKDLDRTFPSHRLFDGGASEGGGQGVAVLRRLLCAFVRRNPGMGYVQSMNYVAATIMVTLLPLDCSDAEAEESAFWLFCAIVERLLPSYYSSTLHGVRRDLATLGGALQRLRPKLAAHLEEIGVLDAVLPMQFWTPWLMKIFVNALPLPTALRLWDRLLADMTEEGATAVLTRAALAMVLLCEEEARMMELSGPEEFSRRFHVACASMVDAGALTRLMDSRRVGKVVAEERARRGGLGLPPPPTPPQGLAGGQGGEGPMAKAAAGASGQRKRPVLQPLLPPPSLTLARRGGAGGNGVDSDGSESDEDEGYYYFLVIGDRATVRADKETESRSVGVLRRGARLRALREECNRAGRLRVQFEYGSISCSHDDGHQGLQDGQGSPASLQDVLPSPAPPTGWVSVVSKTGKVLLQRCGGVGAAPMALVRGSSGRVASYCCCAVEGAAVHAGWAEWSAERSCADTREPSIAHLPRGCIIDVLELRCEARRASGGGLRRFLRRGSTDGGAGGERLEELLTHSLRFELPDGSGRAGWANTHDASATLQLLPLQTTASELSLPQPLSGSRRSGMSCSSGGSDDGGGECVMWVPALAELLALARAEAAALQLQTKSSRGRDAASLMGTAVLTAQLAAWQGLVVALEGEAGVLGAAGRAPVVEVAAVTAPGLIDVYEWSPAVSAARRYQEVVGAVDEGDSGVCHSPVSTVGREQVAAWKAAKLAQETAQGGGGGAGASMPDKPLAAAAGLPAQKWQPRVNPSWTPRTVRLLQLEGRVVQGLAPFDDFGRPWSDRQTLVPTDDECGSSSDDQSFSDEGGSSSSYCSSSSSDEGTGSADDVPAENLAQA